ncbi:hypothetical protein M422DRAFT_254652 [Sphaerobolus stellatus SS14]|uniref:Unplaced genomic scaffold SPHSTscaffold_56, whole genome shotgun sequence n=1 Tax=Sphaerobolus stellatus (strain SS14) TaxID=990650 RepID=A0A0C9UFL6_SPHS4|nr:hypothetical protein M422DRAFT_275363 [Sphaerobolus stellatus SS14]KIJ42246.1 hypothetical protein M422DRAFT_254652 [Sphaerobolus stellatus SS14]
MRRVHSTWDRVTRPGLSTRPLDPAPVVIVATSVDIVATSVNIVATSVNIVATSVDTSFITTAAGASFGIKPLTGANTNHYTNQDWFPFPSSDVVAVYRSQIND